MYYHPFPKQTGDKMIIYIKERNDYIKDGYIAYTDRFDGIVGWGDTELEALENLLEKLQRSVSNA